MPKPARKNKPLSPDGASSSLDWLGHFGLHLTDLHRLLPATPGGMTSSNSFYVNTMVPRTIFRGREQGSIPLTPGRWYMIPIDIVEAQPQLRESPRHLATALSLMPADERAPVSE